MTADFITYIENNMIPNCPVTKGNILQAEDLFRKDIGSLQGKTIRRKMGHVATGYKNLPIGMLERHGQVTLETNIMYMNEVPFVITMTCNIHFFTAELIKNERVATIASSIKQVILMYQRRGFTIKHIHGDGQFEHIKNSLQTPTYKLVFLDQTNKYLVLNGLLEC